MNLQEDFLSLSAEKRRFIHFELCKNALEILNKYFAETGKIKYVESVIGTIQIVDSKLSSDAFESAQKGENLHNADYRFAEPIAALQDDDLSFPANILFGFYSIYNLFQKYVLQRNIDDWLIVNQALSAEINEEKWTELLETAIKNSNEQSNQKRI